MVHCDRQYIRNIYGLIIAGPIQSVSRIPYLSTATDAIEIQVKDIFRYVYAVIRYPTFFQGAIDTIGPDKNRIM